MWFIIIHCQPDAVRRRARTGHNGKRYQSEICQNTVNCLKFSTYINPIVVSTEHILQQTCKYTLQGSWQYSRCLTGGPRWTWCGISNGGGGGGGGGIPGKVGTDGGIMGGNPMGGQAWNSGPGAIGGKVCCSSSCRCTWVYVFDPITGRGATVGGGGGGGRTGRAISASNLHKKRKLKSQ